jgi:cytochrome c biogenesis protein CcmG, thiol:disulfide interchange protein DsbE
MKKLALALPLIFFLAIFILFKSNLNKDPNLLPSLLVNKPIPYFSGPSLMDNNQITNKSLQGKWVLLNVWATWCLACHVEHPILIDMARKHHIDVIGLNYKDNSTEALAYLHKAGNPYSACIYDPKGNIAMQFGVYGTPENFLIDRKGLVRYRYVGPITLEVLEKDLLPRIKEMEGQ